MNKLTDKKEIKEFKDENIIDNEINVTDVTPWFGSQSVFQKTYNRWFRFVWATDWRPERPRSWDLIYNTQTKKIELFYRQFYGWFGVPNINLTWPISYMEWDYAEFNWELRRAIADWWPWVPSAPDWVRDNQIEWRVEPGNFYAQCLWTVNVPPNTETGLGTTSDNILTNEQWVVGNFSITLPRTWNYLVIGSAIINNIDWTAKATLRNRQQFGTFNTISQDIFDLPTITVTTTWTDSLGGGINATSDVTIASIPQITLESVWYLVNGSAWSIISTTLEHDSWGTLSVTWWFTIIQI